MKRLICCLDGTWNSERDVHALTNVFKTHAALAPFDAHGVQQVSRYVRGIASAEGQRAQFLRGAIGMEVCDRIAEGYRFLKDSYDAGDEIYLFGFSRGAFIARSLAGFIALFGIARSASAFDYDAAWLIYRQKEHRRDRDAIDRLRRHCTYPVQISGLGVWDTVGNIGNPIFNNTPLDRRNAFHDMRLHDNVAVALHALSIDEIRGPFSPTLLTVPRDAPRSAGQHVEQVWFSGTHADVGGGWPETALSDVALNWMVERMAALTPLRFDPAKLPRVSRLNAFGLQHASATGKIFAASNLVPYVRLIDQQRSGIAPLRRLFLRGWRTGHVPRSQVSLNERIHDSARLRAGQVVREQAGDASRVQLYAPRNLMRALDVPGQTRDGGALHPARV